MELLVDPHGDVQCIYAEAINLAELGTLSISRASVVDADQAGLWWADLSTVGGGLLGPFSIRSQALAAEMSYLKDHLDRLALSPPGKGQKS